MATTSAVVRGFLFTDVEGSTRLWQSDPDAMSLSLAVHDEILRSSIENAGGSVFSTAGDSFAAAFDSQNEAVACAVEAQLRLARAEWPGQYLAVRMGVHTGTAEQRDGDYFGLSVNRAARIMAAGNGGQILVSWLAAQQLESSDGIELRDLGTHHLKDLADPEHVFEVRHPELPVVEGPIRTVDVRRDNLPAYLTSFVGRSEELVEVGRLVEANRLVTLTGVGGTGKTRLAVEGANAIAESFPDGVWMLELAPITNPAGVMVALMDTLGLRSGEGVSVEDALLGHLRRRRTLLIVDNCEHLLEASADLIKRLLDSCPQQRVLATSREELGLAGERTLRVPSLALPRDELGATPTDAVQLFSDRARTARGTEITTEETPDVVRICRRIDGIPLGIELAAARLRSISVEELADRLDQSFRALSGSRTAALPRQQTLQATIDWSYDLVDPREQATFRRLAVFVGGFDLEAAAAVCGDEGVDAWQVEQDIDTLVGKSLVVPMGVEAGRTRYRLLEPLRQYGQERLRDSGEAESVRGLHAWYFRNLAGIASPFINGPEQTVWARRLNADRDNLRAAFNTLFEIGRLDEYLGMVFDMFTHWTHMGNDVDGVEIGLTGLEAAPANIDAMRLIKACWTTSELVAQFGRPECLEVAKRGLTAALQLGDIGAVARMRLAVGRSLFAVADEGFEAVVRDALELLETPPGDPWWDPTWERGLFLIPTVFLPADNATKKAYIEEAVSAFETVGDRVFTASALSESIACYREGDRSVKDWVVACNRRACALLADAESPGWYAHALWYLGGLLKREGSLPEAVDHLRRGVTRLEAVGDVVCWANASTTLATSEALLRRSEDACKHLAAVVGTMPIEPRPDAFQAYILESAVDVLRVGGDGRKAAVALGASLAMDFLEEAAPYRLTDLEDARLRLCSEFGDQVVALGIEEGRLLGVGETYELVAGWLTEV